MAILTYDLRVVGTADIAKALASVESRFAQHQRVINRTLGTGTATRRATSPQQASAVAIRSNRNVLNSMSLDQRKAFEAERRYNITAHRERLRGIEREKKTEIAKIRAVNLAAKRERQQTNQSFRRAMGTGATGAIGKLAAVGKTGAAMIGVGGAAVAASAVTEQFRLDEKLRRLSVAGRGPGEAGRDPEAMRKEVMRSASVTGIGPEQLTDAAATYVAKTGDLDTAMANLRNFGVVAQATGSSVEDVASTAADLAQKFDIKNAQDMGDALAVLAFQGKKGAFELRDMAAQFPEMAAAAQRAGLSGVGGMRTLGGLAQIARQSTGSGAEASTAVQMMMTQLTNKSGELKSGEALGGQRVNVFEGGDATKAARDLPTVLAEIISKSHGNQTQLSKLFDVRGIRAVSPMIKAYRDASEKAGGGAKGEEAGRQAVLDMIKEASSSSGKFSDVQKDASDVMKASSIQFELALMDLKAVFAEELVPVMKDLVPTVRELSPVFRVITKNAIALAQAIAEHPLAGIGAVLAAGITAELAKAQLSQLVTTGIVTPLGALGLAAGATAASMLAAKAYVDTIWAKGKGKVEEAAKRGDEVRDKAKAELDATGKLTPETRKQLEALQATETEALAKSHAANNEGIGDIAGRAWNTVFGGEKNLEQGALLGSIGSNEKYVAGAQETKQLLGVDAMSQGMSAADAKAAFGAVGAAADKLDKAADKIANGTVNRGNAPSPIKG